MNNALGVKFCNPLGGGGGGGGFVGVALVSDRLLLGGFVGLLC